MALWRVSLLLFACAAAAAAVPSRDLPLNKLIVKWGLIPKLNCFFELPRTAGRAQDEGWTVAADLRDSRGYSLWCREDDYRVCLMFDLKGSVAGIQVSHSVADMKATGVPQDWDSIPDWNRQTILGDEVYSAIAYFVDPDSLLRGGRELAADADTADGIWIERQDGGHLRVPRDEDAVAAATNYTRQGCMFGMGRHYFDGMVRESRCADRRPYYLLFGPQTKQMLGFGVITFGKTSDRPGLFARKWFIHPPALVAPVVAPEGPQCTKQWMSKYGATSLHVYFQDKPWKIRC